MVPPQYHSPIIAIGDDVGAPVVVNRIATDSARFILRLCHRHRTIQQRGPAATSTPSFCRSGADLSMGVLKSSALCNDGVAGR